MSESEPGSSALRSSSLPRWLISCAAAAIGIQALLVAAYLIGRAEPRLAHAVLDLDAEANLPTWWSTLLFLLGAQMAAALAWSNRVVGRSWWHWAVLSVGLLGLSIEELASVHERIHQFIPGLDRLDHLWPLLYAPVLVLGATMLFRVSAELQTRERRLCRYGITCFIFVIVVELLSSDSLLGQSASTIAIEESAEVVGAVLILTAFGSTLASRLMIVPRDAAPGRVDHVDAFSGSAPLARQG